MPILGNAVHAFLIEQTRAQNLWNLLTSRWHGRAFPPLAQPHRHLVTSMAKCTCPQSNMLLTAVEMVRPEVAGTPCRYDYTCAR